MAKQEKLDSPTHVGNMVHIRTAAVRAVRLTETGTHWATPTRLFFRKSDGWPRGQVGASLWRLDLDSVVLRKG